jgi:exonuclease SbcC
VRPLRLDLHGFTVFREPTTVDFTDTDYFVLVGPTGSGKSTILDAICFALYGTVPRWGDRRRIEHALAPSAAQARVRLVFEASGARFVATRVVRRDNRGGVSTSHAGLEQLPAGFDLAGFDSKPAERGEAGLGTVLAGTPAEMDDAVQEAVGLPYEQFTSCVVLPQGEFARFLHAKPRERQEILVNLLGLHVYQRVGERAGAAQREAEARIAATRGVLAELTDVDDAALAAAGRALTAAQALVGDIEAQLPDLAEATAAGEAARVELAHVEREIAALAAVKTPDRAAALADEAAAAHDAASAADEAVLAAEEREEKTRAELAAAGDRIALQRLVDVYADRDRLAARVAELGAALATATSDHDHMTATLAATRRQADKTTRAVTEARRAVDTAQAADRAAALRSHLVVGEPCPVCAQTVSTVPATPEAPALAAARAVLVDAEERAQSIARTADTRDRALRELDRTLAATTAQHMEYANRLAAAQAALSNAPSPTTVEAGLAAIASAERALSSAIDAVRAARQAARRAGTEHKRVQARLREAWREFDRARDLLAAFGPPPPDRDDLVGSWDALTSWASSAMAQRDRSRETALAAAESALAAMALQVARIDGLFRKADAGSAPASGEPAAYRQAAALAVERATAVRDRVVERRAQAARLTEQIAEHERAAQVAKALALHLRADRFERWLLAEALDALVAGASLILRELSGGQYDLAHDKGEFFVVDHTDAGLRRGVRTLSGGETFQASLALALALSEQLAGLSTASASLESIMLDEGFGSLDAATLDTVAATLENLAARGDRMVGVVTHVTALAERIPVRFDVAKDARGVARIVRTG